MKLGPIFDPAGPELAGLRPSLPTWLQTNLASPTVSPTLYPIRRGLHLDSPAEKLLSRSRAFVHYPNIHMRILQGYVYRASHSLNPIRQCCTELICRNIVDRGRARLFPKHSYARNLQGYMFMISHSPHPIRRDCIELTCRNNDERESGVRAFFGRGYVRVVHVRGRGITLQ